ncbi:MAG: CAP domain-containing protein [Geminocystis sp.]|nr:CAP domain-containing protein [Geminocystis sp.]HIK38205.1 CAP domain-containing protein [Geminocystis sp. M7585_C2015_104]MCS7148657.1 CAP domain-containing protein [Geminocystis sp.]MCX8078187.1 CAP domain-containing protein [Geminocystis sp.]MDW8115071.1 CAP domain-containing protein [Geminocystis sp.]
MEKVWRKTGLAVGLVGLGVSFLTAGGVTVAQKTNNWGEIVALENEVYFRVNQYRQSQNLPPLKRDRRIDVAARQHSENMANKIVSFSHDGFEQRVHSTRIKYRRAAENIAYNWNVPSPATEAVMGWINSPSHHRNMTGNFNLTGVGVAKNARGEYYFTQIFILTR